MHARRFACFVLGLWLGGSLFLWWSSSADRRAADNLVERANPAARVQLKSMGSSARLLLDYGAAERSRSWRRTWEIGQILCGGLFFLLMLFGSRESHFLLGGILLMVLLVFAERLLLTPELTAEGRLLDFGAVDAAVAAYRAKLRVLETAYGGVEAAKFGLGLALTASLVFSRRRGGRSSDFRRQLNMVDKANYRRVNR